MDTRFESALRKELIALPAVEQKARGRRRVVAVVGILGLLGAGSVAVANLRPAAEVVTMPIAAPMVIEGTGISTVKLAPVPDNARYLRIELACFESTTCGFAEQSQRVDYFGSVVIERAALPLTDWYDPQDQQRLAPVDPKTGITVRVDPDASWRMYAVFTEQLNPKSAQLPESPNYNPGSYVGIPNNVDYQEQMFIPVVASNGQLGWIGYNTLLGAIPGTSRAPSPVFDINIEKVVGFLGLR